VSVFTRKQIPRWKLYDQLIKLYDVDSVYDELLATAKKIGKPFEKKGKRGRPLGAEPEEYAAYFVFSWNEGHKLIAMERYSTKFLDKHLDHSTFGKIICRIPIVYFILLIEAFAKRIEELLYKATIALADSTAVSTGIYEERMHKGQTIKARKDFKLHILAGYFPEHSLTYIKTALGTDKHTSDAEGLVQMLERIVEWLAYMLADRGYDAEKVHEAITKKKMIDIVKRKKGIPKMASYKSLTQKFFNSNLYKEIRGIIETIFGGLENKGLLKTKLRNPLTIFKYCLAIAINHNQRTSILAGLIKKIRYYFETLE
jgi:IS5 family transposase